MTDCFHSTSPFAEFPSTADQVLAGIAFCNVLANQIIVANSNSYENALGPSKSDDAGCDFDEISKHYSLSSCCYCSDIYSNSYGNAAYACANPVSTVNPTWQYVQSWTQLNAPQAANYYCT